MDERIEVIRNLKHRNYISDEIATKALAHVVSVGAPEKKLEYREMVEGVMALASSGAIDKEFALSVINRLSEYEIIQKPTHSRPSFSTGRHPLFQKGQLRADVIEALKNGNGTIPAIVNYVGTKNGYTTEQITPRIYNTMSDFREKNMVEKDQNNRYVLVEAESKQSQIVPGKYVREASA